MAPGPPWANRIEICRIGATAESIALKSPRVYTYIYMYIRIYTHASSPLKILATEASARAFVARKKKERKGKEEEKRGANT